MDKNEEIELQSAVFQRLVDHLRKETELQNIDLMNLTGFCRNCLGKWYLEAAEERGLDIDYDTAREIIYGMKYEEWKQRYQKPASAEQLEQMNQKGFCRNCLGKWYLEAAEERGLDIDYDTAREKIYGMKYEEWKQRYQKPASAEQLEQMNQKKRS